MNLTDLTSINVVSGSNKLELSLICSNVYNSFIEYLGLCAFLSIILSVLLLLIYRFRHKFHESEFLLWFSFFSYLILIVNLMSFVTFIFIKTNFG